MHFFFRAAAAAAAFSVVSLTSLGTPVLALGASPAADVPTKLVVTDTPVVDQNAVQNRAMIQKVPAEYASPVDGDAPAESLDTDQRFDSLASAVAAQAMPQNPDAELACLAGAIYFEAKGEPLAGQLAVAQVILNRANSGRFPQGICSVVTQAGQFSFVRGGRIPAMNHASRGYREAMAIAQVAVDDVWDGPATSALYFHARRVSPGWRMTRVAAIGNHIFYR